MPTRFASLSSQRLRRHVRVETLLRGHDRARQIVRVAVGVVQPQVLRVVLVVGADADSQQVQLRARRQLAVGADRDLLVVLGENREPERARRLQLLQHQRQHGGAERAGDVLDRDAVGRRVPAVVDVPAQDAVRARGGRVEALRRPGHPIGPVRPAA